MSKVDARPVAATLLAPGLTIYLDLLRVVAAVAVCMSHYLPMFGIGHEAPSYGHDSVVVFLVISGLVVALVCDTRPRGLAEFAFSRLVRLWSVAVPALLIGLSLDVAVNGPSWPAVWAVVINLMFLGESWAGTISPPFDYPFWSLNYEAWFYACFGCLVFLRGKQRVVAVITACVLAGPAIMALAPCWLAGVAAYRWRHRFAMPPGVAALVFVGTLAAAAVVDATQLPDLCRAWLKQVTAGQSYRLGASQALLSDYLLSLLVAANFLAVASLPGLGQVLARVRSPIGHAACLTLSIYLYHLPLIATVRVLAERMLGPSWLEQAWALPVTLGLAGAAIVVLGGVTELQRYRLKWALTELWRHASPKPGAVSVARR